LEALEIETIKNSNIFGTSKSKASKASLLFFPHGPTIPWLVSKMAIFESKQRRRVALPESAATSRIRWLAKQNSILRPESQ